MSNFVELLFGEERGFSARRFRLRQGLFLAAFTILGLLGVAVMYYEVSRDASFDIGINVAGRQRMLTEKATRTALMANLADSPDARSEAKRVSLTTLEQLK